MADIKINVAIVGGGMGGLCLAIALLKHEHLNVQIYEAAHEFSEIGAGVAFGPNAQRAFQLIGPEVEEAYLKLATHNGSPEMRNVFFEYRYGMGEQAGTRIVAPENEAGQSTVHRAKFLNEFIKMIPADIAHFGKRLDRIDDADSNAPITLHFKDDTTVTADCVIGADGVHSVVRRHLLGEDHPAVEPVFTGSVVYRGLIPMEQAVAAIGEHYAKNSLTWVGDGSLMVTYPIDFGETLNVAAINCSYEKWDGPWVQKADFAKIKEEFSAWGPTGQKIIGLLDNPDTAAWSMWDHPRAPYYFRGRVVMMGDAAHASTPFQGQGAGQAIEDSYVLASLFEPIRDLQQLPLAFKAYDRIRRPRSQMVCKTSREAGELQALRLPGVKDDPEAFAENMSWRMDWMWHRDVAGERIEALGLFERLLKQTASQQQI